MSGTTAPIPAPRNACPAPRARLRLLGTTDVHVHLLGFDYFANREDRHVGLAHTATLIAQARAESGNCLLFDNGDFLQGNPMGDYVARPDQTAPRPVHPAIRAMNRLGYDAATLGNHEFNYGLDILDLLLRGAAFPIVSANIARNLGATPLQDKTYLPPHALLRREVMAEDGTRYPLTIGVIGLAPPQIVQWDRQLLEGVLFTRGIVETAAAHVPALRAAGAEIVVALSHSGIGLPDEDDGSENATSALAQVPGLDAIIAGHSHLVFPSEVFANSAGAEIGAGRLFGVPTAMPGFYGSHLGVIDLTLERRGNSWQRVEGRAEVRMVTPDTPPDPAVVEEVRADHEATIAYARRTVGRSDIPLQSYFATIAPCSALQLVARAQLSHVAQHLKGRPEAALPLLSVVSPFKVGGRGGPGNYTDIPAGDLALRHIADLYIFPNTIAALRLSGADLADWLENAVGLYHQIPAGAQDAPLIDDDFPSYNHDCILGLSYEIDLSQPARFDRHGQLRHPQARRLRNLRFAGAPLDPGQEFILATNSYRAAGCGGYAGARTDRLIDVGRMPIRDILIRHVQNGPPLQSAPLTTFRFAPMPGTTVIYDTAPAAMAHLPKIAHLRPDCLGLTETGFARFRLHL